jgi:hypothetical protein
LSAGGNDCFNLTTMTPPCPATVYGYNVRKLDLILRSIERRLQIQFSMGHKFLLWPLRRNYIKPNKTHINVLRLTRHHALRKLSCTGGAAIYGFLA